VLTLYLTPVVYVYFERLQEWFSGAKTTGKQKGNEAVSSSV